jgi:hypothetical protein
VFDANHQAEWGARTYGSAWPRVEMLDAALQDAMSTY